VAEAWLCVSTLLLVLMIGAPALAQTAPCGVVDAIDYPIDISETLDQRYDDFALFRNRFGGSHVGIDIAFNRWGETVFAAARGEVTYADPEGWDTEKGVVIVRHTLPDNSIIYTLYGHMEQTDTLKFPPVGACVGFGEAVGAVGWPSRGLPHLHYEIRDFMPDNGGPGYVTENPLTLGWKHPLDYTLLWQMRLAGGYLGSIGFLTVPSLPPVLLDTGEVIIASEDAIEAYSGGALIWRITLPGAVVGVVGLPGGRVAAHSRGGQAIVLQNGRYLAVWQVAGLEVALQALGETLIFAMQDGGLAAYDPAGALRWQIAGEVTPANSRAVAFESYPVGGGEAALAVLDSEGAVSVRVVDTAGNTVTTTRAESVERVPVLTPYNGGWLALINTDLIRLSAGAVSPIATVPARPGRGARLTVDPDGTAYLLLDDRDGTLIAVAPDGAVRWRAAYPWRGLPVSPLLRTDGACAVYALDMDGTLRAFSAATGELMSARQVYSGGVRNGSPPARVLRAEGDRLLVGAGFLSLYLLDAAGVTGGACAAEG